MRKFNLFGFITLYGILFLIILYKVMNVPITTDELPTVSYYSNFGFWEIMMYPDNIPNNHILNTLLTKCCIILFGKEQWAIRLPNLISFLFFSAGVFYILKLVVKQNSWFFLPAAILFVNPYFLDFFGLCRGYGISSTLVTISVGFMIAGFLNKKSRYIWFSLISSILASYANFTVLIFWVTITIMVLFYFFMESKGNLRSMIKPAVSLFLISAAYLALIMVPIQKMHSTNEFKYWTSRGFYNETVKSMINNWRYDSKLLSWINDPYLIGLMGLVILTNILYFFNKLKKGKYSFHNYSHPTFVTSLLLLLPAFINIAQTKILGTPNLSGRTALFFFPLLSTVIAVTFGLLPEFKKQWINKTAAIFIGVLLLSSFSYRVSLKSVREWYYDQNTTEVISLLKEKFNGKPVSLKTSWFFHPSFYFYVETGKASWIDLQPYDYNIDVTTPSEYYYIFAEDYKALKPRFEVVYKFSPDRWLLKQNTH